MIEFDQKKIKQLREEHAMSREDLATAIEGYGLKVNQATIASWEKNETCPKGTYIATFCNVFNVSVDIFFTHKLN